MAKHILLLTNYRVLLPLAITVVVYFFASDFRAPEKQHLVKIKERGRLIVATRNGPTTYFQASNGPAGLEYDLTYKFARQLGVELDIVLADSIDELHQLLLQDKVDLVASGMPISVSSEGLVRYSSAYQTIKEQIIDLQNTKPRPRRLNDLSSPLSTLATANHLETLTAAQTDHPQLEWVVEQDLDFEELIEKVINKQVRYAMLNSNEVKAVHHYYPELRTAFSLPGDKGLAWAVKPSDDLSLFVQVQTYIHKAKANGFLTELLERYYGHFKTFDYSDTHLFMRRIKSRLPRYEALFKKAGQRYNIDWLLLAAMSHQESHWNKEATSATGVRGLMMLTLNTAAQLGITNRLDPEQSIMGGTRYFSQLHKRLPKNLVEPDRTWMALAAYNVGYGHLKDARTITSRFDKDPDKWVNVKKSLPLLRKRKWYKTVKYGYARGGQPVHYVQNIRRYYDILKRTYPKRPHRHM